MRRIFLPLRDRESAVPRKATRAFWLATALVAVAGFLGLGAAQPATAAMESSECDGMGKLCKTVEYTCGPAICTNYYYYPEPE